MIDRITMLVLLAAASPSVSAAGPAPPARMYKCVDAKGKTYYTQVPPTECLGRNSKVLSNQGGMMKQIEAPTPAQGAAHKAERKTN